MLIFAVTFWVAVFFLVSIFHAYSFTHTVEDFTKFKPETMNLRLKEIITVTIFGVSPQKRIGNSLPTDYGLEYENVSFKSTDNINLKGWLIKAEKPKGTIILAHGYDASKERLLNHTSYLNKNGYNTFLFDFRGFGESDGNYTTLGYYERFDILGAINYLKTRDDIHLNGIGTIGFSMGGAAIVLAARDSGDFKAIVLDSAYPTIHQNAARRFEAVYGFPKFPFATSLTFFGGLIHGFNGFDLAPSNYINKVNAALFIIQGTADEQVTVEDANLLFKNSNSPKRIWLVQGAKHTGSYDTRKEKYEKKVIEFFDSYMAIER
ncbi:MAG: alpha/beta hydrolase [Nanoarchaeota archaeon]